MAMKHWNDRHADMGRWSLEIGGKEVFVLMREAVGVELPYFYAKTYIGGARTEFRCKADNIDGAKTEAAEWYKGLLKTRVAGLQNMIRGYQKEIKALDT